MKNVIKAISSVLIVLHLFTATAFASDTVIFYHTDPAGTPIAMSDSKGKIIWKADYKPFGEEKAVTGTVENDKMFVGKEKDKETGLYYFGARYLKDKIGRFTSVDPVGIRESDLLNPQKLNRYAYALNNPYRYVDPDGREVRLIARKLNIPGGSIGVHTFIEIKPDNPKDFEGQKVWLLSGHGKDGKLVAEKNWKDDLNWKGDLKGSYEIPAPNGKNDTEFIKDIMEAFGRYKSGSRDYDRFPNIDDNEGNCNTISTGALVGGGVSTGSISKLDPSGANPGLGKPLPEMLRKD